MAQTYAQTGTARTGLTPQYWDDNFFTDYVRASRFKPYMGTDEASIIQIREELTKRRGDTLTFALVNELTGAGVTGNSTLKGNEERLGSRSQTLTVDVLRHAIAVDDWDEQKSVIDLREAARAQLREWAQKTLRDDIVRALGQIDGVNFTVSTATQRNTWTSNNQDRVLFGLTTTNYTSIFATAIQSLTAGEQLTPGVLTLMKRMAQVSTPKIKPVYVKEMDQEWYVCFVGPMAWRDLTEDNPTTNVMTLANRDARVRGVDNPLFTGDSLVWNGMVIRQIPEITAETVQSGSAGARIEPVYLCGAQAVGVAWAQRTKSTTDTDDYGFLHGVGVQEIRRIEKLRFGTASGADQTTPKDHGIVTAFVAAASD
jgi:N4-gp56 family major capsid protein